MLLTPKNWHKFQHYRHRSPPWIKLHRSLLDDRKFQSLAPASKSLAMLLWLVASDFQDGQICGDPEDVAYRLRMPFGEFRETLKPLIENGFFAIDDESASTMLASCKQVASTERERETEEYRMSSSSRTDVLSEESILVPNGHAVPVGHLNDAKVKAPKAKAVNVPYEAVMQAYNETCGGKLPRVRYLTSARKLAVRARWADAMEERTEGEALEFFREFFKHVARSRFLMGDATSWKANFGWLMKQENFVKVLENHYENGSHK